MPSENKKEGDYRYTNIKVPIELAKKIDEFLKSDENKKYGFRSRSEAIIHLLRNWLDFGSNYFIQQWFTETTKHLEEVVLKQVRERDDIMRRIPDDKANPVIVKKLEDLMKIVTVFSSVKDVANLLKTDMDQINLALVKLQREKKVKSQDDGSWTWIKSEVEQGKEKQSA